MLGIDPLGTVGIDDLGTDVSGGVIHQVSLGVGAEAVGARGAVRKDLDGGDETPGSGEEMEGGIGRSRLGLGRSGHGTEQQNRTHHVTHGYTPKVDVVLKIEVARGESNRAGRSRAKSTKVNYGCSHGRIMAEVKSRIDGWWNVMLHRK